MRRKFNSELIRLNKYISQSGLCSRRSADQLIISGKVKVNNKLCTALGTKISENDKVIVNNKLIKPERNIYILLNKPKDYISTNKDTHNRKIVFDLIEKQKIILGGSSGINIAGAIKLAKKMGPGKTIVTILCDHGKRYASKIFNKEFLKSKDLPVPDWL